jgi:hypothetical protein
MATFARTLVRAVPGLFWAAVAPSPRGHCCDLRSQLAHSSNKGPLPAIQQPACSALLQPPYFFSSPAS